MTLPKKTSRPIVVDGQIYRWSLSLTVDEVCAGHKSHSDRRKPYINDGNYVTITIEKKGFPGKLARASIYRKNPEIPITPRLVADLVRHAVENKWAPEVQIANLHYVALDRMYDQYYSCIINMDGTYDRSKWPQNW